MVSWAGTQRPSALTAPSKSPAEILASSVGPIRIEWASGERHPNPSGEYWNVRDLGGLARPEPLGPPGAAWFNSERASGVETASWLAWVGNTERTARIWGVDRATAIREAMPVVVPAVLRREGLLDGHGAVIGPDRRRPHDGMFVTGLSGAGKSTLAVSCAVGGARFLGDDSVAIGPVGHRLHAWPRRKVFSISLPIRDALLPGARGRQIDDKIFLNARGTFGSRYAESLAIEAVVFLEVGSRDRSGSHPRSEARTLSAFEAYQRLLMAHPILALDSGAKPCFPTMHRLARLPAYSVAGGEDLLDPGTACAILSELLPRIDR